MDCIIKDLLRIVFTNIIETQAFMFSDVVETLDSDADKYIKTVIEFKGKVNGNITFVTTYEMGNELATNMLGLDFDEEPGELDIIDSLKELLNVTCGNFVTKLEGTDSVFNLSIPENFELNKNQWEDIVKDDDTIKFAVDDYPFIVIVRLI